MKKFKSAPSSKAKNANEKYDINENATLVILLNDLK